MLRTADTTLSLLSQADTLAESIVEQLTDDRFLTSQITGQMHFEPIPNETIHHEWQLITLGISLVLIALVRFSSRNFFRNVQQAFFSLPIFKQMIRDDELFPQGTQLPLVIANILVTATLFFNITEKAVPLLVIEESTISIRIFKIISILMAYFFFRYFMLRLIGLIFKTRQATSRHLYNIHYYQSVASFVLIPVLIFYIYSPSPSLFFFSLILWLSIYFIRIARGMIIVLDVQGYSRFQNFLYICALEILPVIVLVKFIVI